MKINKNAIKQINYTIGVYIFKNKNRVIYVGKSVNIKARLLSHLENAKIDRKEKMILDNSSHIKIVKTNNEFNALLLESKLIKRYKPRFNVRWKDDKSYLYIKITIQDIFPKIFITRNENDKKSVYFGPFSSIKSTENIVKQIRKIFPYCSDKKISRKPCFYSKINLCNPCPNIIEYMKEGVKKKVLIKNYKKNIFYIKKILEGKSNKIENCLFNKIVNFSKDKKYENALIYRNKLYLFQKLINQQILSFDSLYKKNANTPINELTHILKRYYPKINKIKRIECYDISNISFTDATGSMIVFINNSIDKSQYRKFRIKSKKLLSDTQMLEEVLTRRFHNKWTIPDLIVIDGGTPQLVSALKMFRKSKINIPLIGITKKPNRIIVGSYGFPNLKFKLNDPAFNLLILLRDESHRFAKKYHLQLRNSKFIN
jgi:excinuclease ABC subunit C